MKLNPLPWLLILIILCVSWWARRQLIEEQQLAFFCEGGGQSLACEAHRWLVSIFYNSNAMGYVSLLLGGLAVGLLTGVIGIVSLVLHNAEYAAIGFLLGALTLARSQFDASRAQHRPSQ